MAVGPRPALWSFLTASRRSAFEIVSSPSPGFSYSTATGFGVAAFFFAAFLPVGVAAGFGRAGVLELADAARGFLGSGEAS